MFSRIQTFKLALLGIAFLLSHCSSAQQSLTFSVFNEATAIPFTTFAEGPLHPGVQVGTEFDWKQGTHFRLYPTVNAGYMFHRKLFQGLYANVGLGFDFKTSFGLNLKSSFTLGYLRTYTTRQEYQFKDGRYESERDKGNSRFMPSLSLGLGYDLRRNDPRSPEIFFLYQPWVEYPYSPGFIPVMAHTNIHFGARIYTSKWRTEK